MCKICSERFNIHEKGAAHDFHEQMADYYGISVHGFKKKRLTKKSLMSKIEHEIETLSKDEEENVFFIAHLQALQEQPIEDVKEYSKNLEDILDCYYMFKMQGEIDHATGT